jgi:AcrR family transcriptional regulator
MPDTKEQILDAAESRFAEHGIKAVALRQIISEAGVNSAAIHYHFGSKEKLVRAVLARRIEPLNRERLALLDEAEARAGDGPAPIEDIMYALVAPALRLRGSEEGVRFMRLVGRISSETGYMEVLFNEFFQTLYRRITGACRKALPHLSERDRAWRGHLAVGAMMHTLREHEWICRATDGLCDTSDIEGSIQQIVHFMAAGMEAPALETGGGREVPVPSVGKQA